MATRRSRRTQRQSFINFLETCNNIVQDVVRLLKSDNRSIDYMDSSILRLETVATNVLRICQRFPECYELLEHLRSLIRELGDRKSSIEETAYQVPVTKDGTRGRPAFHIRQNQLQFLSDLDFSATRIATILQVSRSTIMRRLRFYGMSITQKYSTISNDELDVHLKPILEENPHLGYRSVQARLRTLGYLCQESRVREGLLRLDPAAVAMRWCDTVQRRTYRVAGPNSLWHSDGNHKLIRWKFVIHGGIDGFSRLIVYLGVSTNNKSATVFSLFLNATQKYGIPSRVRTDHGTENTDLATFMIMERGGGRGSIIQGKSVHNQRIERFWLDLYQGCTNVFYDLFNFMEEEGILDIDNDMHLWSLHYIYTPRIQRSLDVFCNQWNCHKLRTENGKTPKQLFVMGALQLHKSHHIGISDIFETETDFEDNFGVDWDGPVPVQEREDDVVIEETDAPLSQELLTVLKEQVDPLSDEANDFGMTNYLNTLTFVETHSQ